MGSFKDTIIRLLKNIVEEAEREKKAEEEKTLLRQANQNPTAPAVAPLPAAEKNEITDQNSESEASESTIHSLLHKGKDSLSTRFLTGPQTDIALPPSTLGDKMQLVDLSYNSAQLDSSWHHLEEKSSAEIKAKTNSPQNISLDNTSLENITTAAQQAETAAHLDTRQLFEAIKQFDSTKPFDAARVFEAAKLVETKQFESIREFKIEKELAIEKTVEMEKPVQSEPLVSEPLASKSFESKPLENKPTRAARILNRDNQTRLYSGSSEEEPCLLASNWHSTPDDNLTTSSPMEESFKKAAENGSTSPATLAWLSSLVSPEVRASVASNEKTPAETLRKLANDVDNTVRLSLAGNPSTPIDVLRNLSRDSSKLTAAEAQAALSARGDVVEAERKSHDLLSNNRFNPTSNHLVASYTTLDAVMPDGINDGSKADSEWQSLSSDGARQAYKQQKDTVKDLKFNASVKTNGPAKQLPSYHAAFDKPPEGASEAESVAFYKMVATRLSTPPTKLLELSMHKSAEIRAAVAENISSPVEAFHVLAKDHQAQVKLRVIDNSNCPPAVLQILKEDQDPYVAYEAKNQLKRLENIATQERSANHSLEGLL